MYSVTNNTVDTGKCSLYYNRSSCRRTIANWMTAASNLHASQHHMTLLYRPLAKSACTQILYQLSADCRACMWPAIHSCC